MKNLIKQHLRLAAQLAGLSLEDSSTVRTLERGLREAAHGPSRKRVRRHKQRRALKQVRRAEKDVARNKAKEAKEARREALPKVRIPRRRKPRVGRVDRNTAAPPARPTARPSLGDRLRASATDINEDAE